MATQPINEEEEEDEFDADAFDMGGLAGGLESRKFEPAPLTSQRGRDTKPRGHQRKATPVMDPSWVLNANKQKQFLSQKVAGKLQPQAGNIVKPARWNYTGPTSQFKQTGDSSNPEIKPSSSSSQPSQATKSSPPKVEDVAKWSVARVRMWAVQSLQSKFVDKFCKSIDTKRVDGPKLLTIDDAWLKEAGFNVGFHRKLIMKRVKLLTDPPAPAAGEIKIGDKVLVSGRRGTVRFMGDTHFGADLVGVELDAPKGDNDGTMDGKRYFECRRRHGIFTRTAQCELTT